MRVIITGSTGRLGGAFLSLWGQDHHIEVIAPGRGQLDLAQPASLCSALQAMQFDVLVNAAAITGLEQCLDEPKTATAVNTTSPRVMAEVCRKKGARLVHFSTDYVLSGEQPGLKAETDATGAVNVYGASKEAAEDAVMEADPTALVGRVSWLFGPDGRPSHFDQVLDRSRAGECQELIDDKFSMPTFTHDVVGWVGQLLKTPAAGVYHLCNSGEPESWYSYAQKVIRLASCLGDTVKEENLLAKPIAEAVFFRDQRPIHTAMCPARIMAEEIARPRHWLDAAKDYMEMR